MTPKPSPIELVLVTTLVTMGYCWGMLVCLSYCAWMYNGVGLVMGLVC